jgi:hypothetical protein
MKSMQNCMQGNGEQAFGNQNTHCKTITYSSHLHRQYMPTPFQSSDANRMQVATDTYAFSLVPFFSSLQTSISMNSHLSLVSARPSEKSSSVVRPKPIQPRSLTKVSRAVWSVCRSMQTTRRSQAKASSSQSSRRAMRLLVVSNGIPEGMLWFSNVPSLEISRNNRLIKEDKHGLLLPLLRNEAPETNAPDIIPHLNPIRNDRGLAR